MAVPFRLASVKKLRERERDTAAMAVQEVHRAIEILESRATEIREENQAMDRERQQALQGSISVHRLLDSQRYQIVLLGQLQHIQQQQQQLQQEKHAREAILVKHQQSVKVLEKLEEKHDLEQQRIAEARQQSRIDEWSTVRSAKNTHPS